MPVRPDDQISITCRCVEYRELAAVMGMLNRRAEERKRRTLGAGGNIVPGGALAGSPVGSS
jgi:hypothetical protein